jgi:peptidoglycan/xylan/chitin deacetylase (PgdA/CDA1 family)
VIAFDVDAESAVLQVDRAYAERLTTMSHQAYGPRVGIPRLLAVLRRREVRATFFVPGLTASLYPDVIRRIVAEGHEVAWHGELHEPPPTMTRDALRRDLELGVEMLEQLAGTRPVGYRAPWWDQSIDAVELLGETGYDYDSSLMDDDVPYLIETPSATLVELPVHWSLDDWEHYGFFIDPPLGDNLECPSKLYELWTGELEAMREESCLAILTMHPFLSGRPARARNLEAIIRNIQDLGDVWFATAAEVAGHARGVIPQSEARIVRSALDPQYGQRDPKGAT